MTCPLALSPIQADAVNRQRHAPLPVLTLGLLQVSHFSCPYTPCHNHGYVDGMAPKATSHFPLQTAGELHIHSRECINMGLYFLGRVPPDEVVGSLT